MCLPLLTETNTARSGYRSYSGSGYQPAARACCPRLLPAALACRACLPLARLLPLSR